MRDPSSNEALREFLASGNDSGLRAAAERLRGLGAGRSAWLSPDDVVSILDRISAGKLLTDASTESCPACGKGLDSADAVRCTSCGIELDAGGEV